MHQPFYKDLMRGTYVMPWAYLHATKDYGGMAALAAEFPDVHQTFNLVPSLIVQIEEYANGTARDPLFDLAFRPIEELQDGDRDAIVTQFFPVPVRTMIDPFPRYQELYGRRERHEPFSDQDLCDVQVWWTLAWMDHDRRPQDFINKGRDFSEADKAELRQAVMESIRQVIPEYRKAQAAGAIEISTSPFYHPILPILIDSRVDDPQVPVEVHLAEDAREQLQRARDFMAGRFGAPPRGLWPSEGSVSNDVAALASSLGFSWMATDEGILAKSGVDLSDRRILYRPYRRDNMTVFFRDRTMSDLIGFNYMHGNVRDNANDLVRRINELPDQSHVTIALDGENPWDYYPNSGRDFLRFVYEGVRANSRLEGVTLSEACDRLPSATLNWLAPGSWANGNFYIWIGHSEDHEAWRWILRARAVLMERKKDLSDENWKLAYEELLIAEGSDWMWWFGNDFSSEQDPVFDSLFRRHIGNIYRLSGSEPPPELSNPIKKNLEGRRSVMPLP